MTVTQEIIDFVQTRAMQFDVDSDGAEEEASRLEHEALVKELKQVQQQLKDSVHSNEAEAQVQELNQQLKTEKDQRAVLEARMKELEERLRKHPRSQVCVLL